MTVPSFQDMMLPYLSFLADGQVHRHADTLDQIAQHFRLTEEQLREMLPSGRQAAFDNRAGWARTYLGKAGLIESVARGFHQITEEGLAVLRGQPTAINMKFLERYPNFREFRQRTVSGSEAQQVSLEPKTEQTPEEVLELSFTNLRQTLAQELQERLRKVNSKYFEQIVVDVLVKMGYGGSRQDAGQAIGRSGDGGIDGIIKEDRLGLDVIYIQAKRWSGTVGRPEIQQFIGALEERRARKGVFITTSQFTKEARGTVERTEKKIILIDGEQLAQLMIEYGVGVTEKAIYIVKRVDEDYFIEE